ncbi:hypothetical protein OG21DRAFT_1569363 [Imleria badia]|nr:hypothetical protein OG21DRAFT_1569363 [Imleria badia]
MRRSQRALPPPKSEHQGVSGHVNRRMCHGVPFIREIERAQVIISSKNTSSSLQLHAIHPIQCIVVFAIPLVTDLVSISPSEITWWISRGSAKKGRSLWLILRSLASDFSVTSVASRHLLAPYAPLVTPAQSIYYQTITANRVRSTPHHYRMI